MLAYHFQFPEEQLLYLYVLHQLSLLPHDGCILVLEDLSGVLYVLYEALIEDVRHVLPVLYVDCLLEGCAHSGLAE